MSKHTEGPWEVFDDGAEGINVVAPNGYIVGSFNNGGEDSPEERANAERIAACVNALNRVETPAEYVHQTKRALALLAVLVIRKAIKDEALHREAEEALRLVTVAELGR